MRCLTRFEWKSAAKALREHQISFFLVLKRKCSLFLQPPHSPRKCGRDLLRVLCSSIKWSAALLHGHMRCLQQSAHLCSFGTASFHRRGGKRDTFPTFLHMCDEIAESTAEAGFLSLSRVQPASYWCSYIIGTKHQFLTSSPRFTVSEITCNTYNRAHIPTHCPVCVPLNTSVSGR